MQAGPLNEPQGIVVRGISIGQRHTAAGIALRQVAEFLGIAAGEIGIVIGLELFPCPQRSIGPVRKIAPVLVSWLMRARSEVHGTGPGSVRTEQSVGLFQHGGETVGSPVQLREAVDEKSGYDDDAQRQKRPFLPRFPRSYAALLCFRVVKGHRLCTLFST